MNNPIFQYYNMMNLNLNKLNYINQGNNINNINNLMLLSRLNNFNNFNQPNRINNSYNNINNNNSINYNDSINNKINFNSNLKDDDNLVIDIPQVLLAKIEKKYLIDLILFIQYYCNLKINKKNMVLKHDIYEIKRNNYNQNILNIKNSAKRKLKNDEED